MRKRTSIYLDQELVKEASKALGTHKISETVHRSMDEVIRLKKLRSLASRDFPDLSLTDLERLRTSRTGTAVSD